MSTGGIDLAAIEGETEHDEGIFGDHLRPAESFYRLRSAGIIQGASARAAEPRCRLYAAYLARHLL
jgi:hypothetical protein